MIRKGKREVKKKKRRRGEGGEEEDINIKKLKDHGYSSSGKLVPT